MAQCSKCGQPLPGGDALDADMLLHLLQHGAPHREVYRGQDGNWYVTHGGGPALASAVDLLVRRGAIASVYNNCPNDCYHVGKTLDTEATMAELQNHRRRKDAPLVYTDGSREPKRR